MNYKELILSTPNRQSGDWLLGVENCQRRMIPCGNTRCCDEIMRVAQSVSHPSIETVRFEAHRMTVRCANGPCPINHDVGFLEWLEENYWNL